MSELLSLFSLLGILWGREGRVFLWPTSQPVQILLKQVSSAYVDNSRGVSSLTYVFFFSSKEHYAPLIVREVKVSCSNLTETCTRLRFLFLLFERNLVLDQLIVW